MAPTVISSALRKRESEKSSKKGVPKDARLHPFLIVVVMVMMVVVVMMSPANSDHDLRHFCCLRLSEPRIIGL